MVHPPTDEQALDAPATLPAPSQRPQATRPGSSVVCDEAEFVGTMVVYMKMGMVPFGEACFAGGRLHIRSSA